MSNQDLIHGYLDEASWADFVSRLRYDCNGDRVNDHCTAEAIFIVQARRRIVGIDLDFTVKLCLCDDEGTVYESKEDYWQNIDEEHQQKLNREAQEFDQRDFLELEDRTAFDIACGVDENLTFTGWDETWEYVCSHFTHAAAERFIARKKHDYPLGLRVYTDAQIYCWEYNAIKEGILSGKITYVN